MVMLAAAAAGATGCITTWLGTARRNADMVESQSETGKTNATAFSPAKATIMTPEMTLISRKAWDAAEPSVSEDGHGEYGPYDPVANPSGWLVYDQPLTEILNRIIIHHSALPLSDGPREIQRLHMEEKGFADVGYHFLIDQTGRLYEGRALNVRGAHTYGANYGSVGICLIGNFEELVPTAVQLTTLQGLLTSLTAQFPRIVEIAGHRDLNSGTLCPGANLYPLLPELAQTHHLKYIY